MSCNHIRRVPSLNPHGVHFGADLMCADCGAVQDETGAFWPAFSALPQCPPTQAPKSERRLRATVPARASHEGRALAAFSIPPAPALRA